MKLCLLLCVLSDTDHIGRECFCFTSHLNDEKLNSKPTHTLTHINTEPFSVLSHSYKMLTETHVSTIFISEVFSDLTMYYGSVHYFVIYVHFYDLRIIHLLAFIIVSGVDANGSFCH